MIRRSIAAAVLIAGALLASEASADISRGCSGAIIISTGGDSFPVAGLEGRAHCKNRIHANDCRKRARDAIMTCVRDIWTRRGVNALPPTCTIFGGGRPSAKLTWTEMRVSQPNKLVNQIRWAACCKMRPTANSAALFIRAFSTGDNKCGSSLTLNPNSQAACSTYRAAGLCN